MEAWLTNGAKTMGDRVTSDQDNSARIADLARQIASCPSVEMAYAGQHQCSDIVGWQRIELRKLGVPESQIRNRLHRPEPWAGNLSSAKIVYLSSNPSFDDDENFPTWDPSWDDEKIEDFFVNRFSDLTSRGYGAGDEPHVSWDKVIQKDQLLSKKRVSTWSSLRKRTGLILGVPVDQVSASRDYVMTEVVHCKSQKEHGVTRGCISHCGDRWFSQVLDSSICPAGLIVVSGVQAAIALRKVFPDIAEAWGPPLEGNENPENERYWPRSIEDLENRAESGSWSFNEQSRHTVCMNFFGKKRLVVWLPHPTGNSLPRKIDNQQLIHPDLLKRWREAAKNGGC